MWSRKSCFSTFIWIRFLIIMVGSSRSFAFNFNCLLASMCCLFDDVFYQPEKIREIIFISLKIEFSISNKWKRIEFLNTDVVIRRKGSLILVSCYITINCNTYANDHILINYFWTRFYSLHQSMTLVKTTFNFFRNVPDRLT